MHSTLLRSATHATDSTFSGCNANNAATIRLRPVYPVNHCKIRNRSNAPSPKCPLAAAQPASAGIAPAAPPITMFCGVTRLSQQV